MRYLYSFLIYLALPFILLRLWWRGRRAPGYRQRWRERFGHVNDRPAKPTIWIHAVSVGETLAATPLIKILLKNHPAIPVWITSTTPTGSERVLANFGNQVLHSYAPYDVPHAVERFIKHARPQLLIIMETELWPNLLHAAAKHAIPTLIVNARLSARSAKGYARIQPLSREMMQNITHMAAQYEDDARRFIALGCPPEKITITGNNKFDIEIPADLLQRGHALRAQWGTDRPIWIAASTHEGEEQIILAAFAQIRKKLPQLLLVLVPRHPERFARVTKLCEEQHYPVVLRSSGLACDEKTAIFIGDTMGELLLFFAASDCAFVGGSLIQQGGHNPLEPAALGIPVCMGPHVFNFAVICEQLKNANALIEVQNATELATCVMELLQNPAKHQAMSEQGKQVVAKNRGALAKQVALIEKFIT